MDEKIYNLGYFFQRGYYEGLSADMLLNNKSEETEKYFFEQNKKLISSSKINVKIDTPIEGECIYTISLKTTYPGLITGIGMVHETGMIGEAKLGMAFDYTSGLPYIPGSSIKGLLRSMFPIIMKKPEKGEEAKTNQLLEEKRQYIFDTIKHIINSYKSILENKEKEELKKLKKEEIDELAKMIFDGEKSDNSFLSIYERDIFFDAYIEGDYIRNGILGFDYITPHKDVLKDPNPIKFLKVLPEVEFVFRFELKTSKLESGTKVSGNAKKELFKDILTTVGVGAKTNVGYGQLK